MDEANPVCIWCFVCFVLNSFYHYNIIVVQMVYSSEGAWALGKPMPWNHFQRCLFSIDLRKNESDHILICWSCSHFFLSLSLALSVCFDFFLLVCIYTSNQFSQQALFTAGASIPFIFTLNDLKGCHCVLCNKSFTVNTENKQGGRHNSNSIRGTKNEWRKKTEKIFNKCTVSDNGGKQKAIHSKAHKALIRNANNWYIAIAKCLCRESLVRHSLQTTEQCSFHFICFSFVHLLLRFS